MPPVEVTIAREMGLQQAIGKVIRLARHGKMTQKKLAMLSGILQSTISEIETKGTDDLRKIEAVARALGMVPSQLIQAAERYVEATAEQRQKVDGAADMVSKLDQIREAAGNRLPEDLPY